MDIWDSFQRDDEWQGTRICTKELSVLLWTSMQLANHEAKVKDVSRFNPKAAKRFVLRVIWAHIAPLHYWHHYGKRFSLNVASKPRGSPPYEIIILHCILQTYIRFTVLIVIFRHTKTYSKSQKLPIPINQGYNNFLLTIF